MTDRDDATAPAAVPAEPTAVDGRHHAGAGAGVATATSWAQRLLRIVFVFVIACVAVTPFVVHSVHTYRAVNPVDEASYIDYLSKVDSGHFIVGEGENDDATVDHAVQCRGVGDTLVGQLGYQIKPDPAACAGAPHAAFDTRDGADIDPPTYYVLTDVGVKVLRGLGVTHDIVNAGRLMGIIWGGLSLTLLYFLARLLGARRWPAALVCGIVAVTPQIDIYWSYITPHATDLAVGAAATIVVLQWQRRRLPTWSMLLAGLLTVIVEGSDIIVGLLLVLFALISAGVTVAHGDGRTHERRPEVVRHLLGALFALVGIAVGSAVWLKLRKHYALTKVPAFQSLYNAPHFRFSYLLDQVGAFAHPYDQTAGYVVALWVLGSVVYYASRPAEWRTEDGQLRALAVAALPVVAFGAWVFVISDYVTEHQYHPIQNRYALTLLPILYAYAALNLRSRWVQAAGVVLLGLLAYIVAFPSPTN